MFPLSLKCCLHIGQACSNFECVLLSKSIFFLPVEIRLLLVSSSVRNYKKWKSLLNSKNVTKQSGCSLNKSATAQTILVRAVTPSLLLNENVNCTNSLSWGCRQHAIAW